MKMLVLPTELRPGDVYLSAADGRPHWIDEVQVGHYHVPAKTVINIAGNPVNYSAIDEETRVLICEGERRFTVHNMRLSVLIDRPDAAAIPATVVEMNHGRPRGRRAS